MLRTISVIASMMRQDSLLSPTVPREDLGRRSEELAGMIEALRRCVYPVDIPEPLTWKLTYEVLESTINSCPQLFKEDELRAVRFGLAVFRDEVNKYPDRRLAANIFGTSSSANLTVT